MRQITGWLYFGIFAAVWLAMEAAIVVDAFTKCRVPPVEVSASLLAMAGLLYIAAPGSVMDGVIDRVIGWLDRKILE